MLVIDLASGTSKELIYPLDNRSYGVNELVAINSTEFLAIERDGAAGAAAVAKRVYKINIAAATDVSAIATLPPTGLPAGTVAATKSLFLDLLNPAFGLAGASFPEKIEGLTIGPVLPDGRFTLVVTNDNDFLPANPNNFYVFAVDRADLTGYVAQQFDYPPLPPTPTVPTLSSALLIALMMLLSLSVGDAMRRRKG